MNREEIEQSIPHRAPFLWIDEVTEISDKRIHARKHLPADLPVFAGHFPAFPVFPGVLQCEAAFQAGAILIAQQIEMPAGHVPVVTRQNNTQFRHLVRPGDTLEIDVELKERLAKAFFLNGKVSVNGKTSVRLEFACTLAPTDAG